MPTPAANNNEDDPFNTIPSIRLTELIALDYPATGYEYRGVIRWQGEAGTDLREQTLPARRTPEWLVSEYYQPPGNIQFLLYYRSEDQAIWNALSPVVIPLPNQASDQSSPDTYYLPLRGWNAAPSMRMRIRLTSEQPEDRFEIPLMHPSFDSTNSTPAGCPFITPKTTPARPAIKTVSALSIADHMTGLPSLTAQEQVLVKDIWNKFLAYQDMLIELFVERLLHEEPELTELFGDAIDLVPGYFAHLFDRSVRQLMPHTEQILRESYRGVYPSPPQPEQTAGHYITLLTDLGMQPTHWLTARRVWSWVQLRIPHLEEYDQENLSLGAESAMHRFFTLMILNPALEATQAYAEALTTDTIRQMRQVGDLLAANARVIGTDFYHVLFATHPDIIPYFNRTDIDSLTEHLMQAVSFLVRSLDSGQDIMRELRELSQIHANFSVPPDAYPKLVEPLLTVLRRHVPDFSAEHEQAWAVLLNRVTTVLRQPMINQERILKQAKEYIDQVAGELAWHADDHERRWEEIQQEVKATGTYIHTYEELAYGAQLAWRNASKCIGRISWKNMIVRDLRHVTDPDEMFRECAEHLRMATNGGNIQIVMSVFRPKKPQERWGPRIWNSQYIRFAAYEQPDGTILGDKANLKLTQTLIQQGWVPPASKTAYDTLPLVIDVPGQPPRMYSFNEADVLKVAIEHPSYPALSSLDLKWCTVPAITNFRLDIGGIQYGCIPFNGWFMETEIARNLWEEDRYDQAEAIARAIGLDTSSEQTLWRDRAFLELNVAILHSFSKARVTLVDHQTAARQFLAHDQREKRAGRECPAQWSWVVPAAGGSVTPVWHHEMRDFYLSPSYHHAADRWVVISDETTATASESNAGELLPENLSTHRPGQTGAPDHRPRRVLILYGSETGTAESFAYKTARRLSRFEPHVLALNDCDSSQLAQESLVLVVTSTFREGNLPANAQAFHDRIQAQPPGAFSGLSFSVMALGSTIYPHFCAAGITLDRELARVGGNRVVSLHKGDEIKGQADTFRQWLDLVARLLGEDATLNQPPVDAGPGLTVSFLPPVSVPAAPAPTKTLPGHVVPVLANRELLKEVIVGSRSTRFIALDISGLPETYETGDHVAIYPHNPPATVQRLLTQLGIDHDAWFTTTVADATARATPDRNQYPEPVRVWQVLTEDLDLAIREPFDELVGILYKAATSLAEREELAAWQEILKRAKEDSEAFINLKKHISGTLLTLVDWLDAFPSARLSLAQVLTLLPRQKPRMYSISSCSLVHPTEIHLTVGVVQVTTEAGKTVAGLCSNYLAGLLPGEPVRIAVRSSGFRPPKLPHAPMLMVGAGTGLSPLLGFLQHREVQLRALHKASITQPDGLDTITPLPAHIGHARLFFGCRNLNDYLYRQELESWHEAGVLTHLDVAFSRLDDEKIYVQDLIGQRSKDIWEVLSQPDCHYYLCGDARMADDVFTTLMTIARTTGGLSHAEAVNFFRRMQAENRFVMDVWGVLFNVQQSLAELRDAKYSQGERWLERVSM